MRPIQPTAFADPIVSASIYCADRLDSVISEVALPLWDELNDCPGPVVTAMWMVRYGRCGEHLKLRLHGVTDARVRCVELLTKNVERYFGGLRPDPVEREREARAEVPAIDAADERVEPYPDRTLLWTAYRRSHVSLAGEPFLSDDRYAVLATTCLAGGCQIVLAAFRAGHDGIGGERERQNVLLRSVIDVLAVLGWAPDRRAAYLRYHRDSLVRFAAGGDHEEESALHALFMDEIRQLRSSVEVLASVLHEHPGTPVELAEAGDPGAAFSWSVANLMDFVTMVGRAPRYRVDPRSPDPAFPVMFKALHGLANQLGLRILREAFAYGLLLHASSQGDV